MKFMQRAAAICGLMLLTGAFCGTAGAELFALAENGQSSSVVIISPGADAVERHAADELCYFLSKVTGAEIRQSELPLPGKFSIWLGTPGVNPGISSSELLKLVNGLSDQGFLLYSDEKGLVIAGAGQGSLPPEMWRAVELAASRDVITVIASRCAFGGTSPGTIKTRIIRAGNLNGPKSRLLLMTALNICGRDFPRISSVFVDRSASRG